MSRRLGLQQSLCVVTTLVLTWSLCLPAFAGVRFSGEELTPKPVDSRKNQTIPYTLMTLEMLSPLEIEKGLLGRLEAALMARQNLIRAQVAKANSKRIKILAQKRDAARQEILPELYEQTLVGSSAIARSLLEWDESQIIYEEDLSYYKKALKRFKACKADCEEPEKPFPDYGELIAGLEDSMPPEDEPRMQVYNLYLRGLLYEASADEVGAVAVYGEAVQTGNSRLIPEIHTRIGDLERSIGNYKAAAHQYESVAFGEYYAESRVKQAWVYLQLTDCKNVLKVAARFRHTVSSEVDQKRFGSEMLQYEVECAAYYLRMDEVVEFDPAGVSLIEHEVEKLKEARRRQGSRTVVRDDFRTCLSDALQNSFEVTELSLKLAGTTRFPEFTWSGSSEVGDLDVAEPEEVYAANIASCMARRLEMFPVVTALSGSVTLVVP